MYVRLPSPPFRFAALGFLTLQRSASARAASTIAVAERVCRYQESLAKKSVCKNSNKKLNTQIKMNNNPSSHKKQ